MVHFLIENGAIFAAQTTRGVQPIHEGVAYGSREIAKILLDHGAAVDSTDLDGIQPLHYASHTFDQPDVIRYLHSQGANIEARCSERHSQRPVSFASACDSVENLKALLFSIWAS